MGAFTQRLKTHQRSACDNQRLLIGCQANYSIDVIAAKYTLLEAGQEAKLCAANQPGPDKGAVTASLDWPKPACLDDQPAELDEAELERQVKDGCRSSSSCALDLKWPEVAGQAGANATQAECARRRQLLEVAYKCKPERFSRRYVCAGKTVHFDCPADRQLVIAGADFGAHRDEIRVHESCGASTRQPVLTAAKPACWANPSQVMGALQASCAGKRACSQPVSAATLGQTGCPPGQVEYLRALFVCVHDDMALVSQPAPTWPPSVAPAPAATSAATSTSAATPSPVASLEPAVPVPVQNSRRPSPQPVLLSTWSGAQSVRYLLASHQFSLALVGCAALSLVLLGALVRVCRSGGRASRQSNRKRPAHSGSSASSDSSSGSSSAGFVKSSAAAARAADKLGGALLAGKAHGQLNSCSESCFSLDDYQLSLGGLAGRLASGGSGAGSPSLDSQSQQHQVQQYQQVKPRLWTIQGQHEQARNSQLQQHQTLRATRTFVGQPQVPAPASSPSSQHLCSLHAAANQLAANEYLLAAMANQQRLTWVPNQEQLAPAGLAGAEQCAFHAQFGAAAPGAHFGAAGFNAPNPG